MIVLGITSKSTPFDCYYQFRLNKCVVDGYKGSMRVTKRLVCISDNFENWFWVPVRPKIGETRLWLSMFKGRFGDFRNNAAIKTIVASMDEVSAMEGMGDLSVECVIKGNIIRIDFLDREDKVVGAMGKREEYAMCFIKMTGYELSPCVDASGNS